MVYVGGEEYSSGLSLILPDKIVINSHLTHKMPSGQRAMTVLCSTTIDNKRTAELWANSILKGTNVFAIFSYLDYIHHRE